MATKDPKRTNEQGTAKIAAKALAMQPVDPPNARGDINPAVEGSVQAQNAGDFTDIEGEDVL